MKKFNKVLGERSSINMLRFLSICSGCKMFFNRKVKDVSYPFINLRYQDSIIQMAIANTNGVFSFIDRPCMYYRLHDTNTCGVHETSKFDKFKHIKETLKGQWRFWYLWKVYGGENFLKFLYYRYRIYITSF